MGEWGIVSPSSSLWGWCLLCSTSVIVDFLIATGREEERKKSAL